MTSGVRGVQHPRGRGAPARRRAGARVALLALLTGLALLTVAVAVAVPAGAARPRARQGGSLAWGLVAETTGGYCLPQAQLAPSGLTVAYAIYDPLIAMSSTGQYVPYLAKAMTPNATYDEWTITLRPGVQFHDGTPVDAAAVKLNLDSYRGANPRLPARLSNFVFQDIASVDAPGPLTVVVRTKRPWPALPAFLNYRYGMVAPAQLADPATCPRNLIGSGPFRLVRWVPNRELVVERNPDYWRRGLPSLDRITFRPIPDGTARLNQLEGGQLDLAVFTSATQIVGVRDLVREGRLDSIESARGSEVTYLMMNVSKPPFDDPLARRIAAYGRSTEVINRVINRGLFPLAGGPFPPGTIGHLDRSIFPQLDRAKARRLHAQYKRKYGHPLEWEYLAVNDPENLKIAELIKDQARADGVKVSIRAVDQSTVINEALAGSFQGVGFQNHPGGDPDTQYNWWKSDSPVNFGRFKDAEIDRLLDAGRVETDPAERRRIYEDLNRRFAKQLWNLWSWNPLYAAGFATDVRGVAGVPLPDGGGRPPVMPAGVIPAVGLRRT